MPILTTNLGLDAIANAEAGGFLIKFSKFSVTEATNVQLAVTDVSLTGPVVYEAAIQNIEVVGPSTIRVTSYIPVAFPAVGALSISEFGLYLDSGQLFAHGTFKAPYIKNKEFGLRIITYVTARRLSETINITVSTNSSLASTANVHTLPAPLESEQNAVVVFDANETEDGATSAAVAIKYGPGGLNWAFTGHRRVYHGKVSAINSATEFSLGTLRKHGIWLNDQEVIIVQILSGPGVGASRKVRYGKTSGETFSVLRSPFPAMTTGSEVALWREVSNILPTRSLDLAEYMVLGHGTTNFKRDFTSSVVGDLIPQRVLFTSTGSATIVLPSDVPAAVLANKKNFVVFVAQRMVPVQGFDVSGANLLLSFVPPSGTKCEVLYYATVPGSGASLTFFETTFEDRVANVVPNTTSGWYQLPMIPLNSAYTLAFLNGLLLSPSAYTLNPGALHFASGNVSGNLIVLTYANYADAGSATKIDRIDLVSTGSKSFTFAKEITSKKNILATRNGQYLPQDQFNQVGSNDIELNFTPSAGDIFSMVLFSAGPQPATASESGSDTGPEWTDPMGRVGPPNLLNPKIFAGVGDGSIKTFSTYQVSEKRYILIFVNSLVVDPRSFSYNVDTSKVTLDTAVPAGQPIDIISFVDESDPDIIISDGNVSGAELGNVVDCRVTRVATTVALSYTLVAAPLNGEHVIATVDGYYVHHSKFSVTGNVITFSAIASGKTLEVWDLHFTPATGMRTELYWDFDKMQRVSTTSYPTRKPVAKEENTLIFNSGKRSMYLKDTYSIAVSKNGQKGLVVLPSVPVTDLGKELLCLTFVSGKPLPRLALLSDIEDRFLPSSGDGGVMWDDLAEEVKERIACPMAKLLGIATGVMDADFQGSNGTADDVLLAGKWGLQPVTKSLLMDVIPTANYASVGAGMALGVAQRFSVYDYLNIYLKDLLGKASFTINSWERGVKYIIDDVSIGDLQTEVLNRTEIPMIASGTGIYINYPNKLMSTTYPTMPYLTTFFDMAFSRDNSVLPAGFSAAATLIRTVSVSIANDDATQYRIYTHVIQDDYTGRSYTVVWKRTYQVADLNTEYMVEVSSGGAPGYVRYFARLYCNWKYNDYDIRTCMYYNKISQAIGGISDIAWPAWLATVRGGGSNYPAAAPYTAGLTFGVAVSSYSQATGEAVVAVNMTSGDIGYAYFPANALVKKITVPVTYTIYPGMTVNEDGTIKPVMSIGDLFTSCCWGTVTDAVTSINCD